MHLVQVLHLGQVWIVMHAQCGPADAAVDLRSDRAPAIRKARRLERCVAPRHCLSAAQGAVRALAKAAA